MISRFRGMISTQPGSTSLSSFKIISLEEEIPKSNHGNDIGPFGDQDDEQVRDYSPIWPERPWVSDIWRGVAYRLFLNGGGAVSNFLFDLHFVFPCKWHIIIFVQTAWNFVQILLDNYIRKLLIFVRNYTLIAHQ